MKVLIFWDIYGRVGRKAFLKHYKELFELHMPDFVIANIENMSSGRGPILKHIQELAPLGIDVYTSGNHIFDNEESIELYLDAPDSKLIRPANFFESSYVHIPGKGWKIIEKNGKKLLVVNLMSSVFMRDQVYNPFLKIDEILKQYAQEHFDGIIIDFHRETTAEIAAMGGFLDGKVSFIYGTHTHTQTNDEKIFPLGTGVLTDVGMSGPYYWVIWADFESLKSRYLSGVIKGKIEQSLDPFYVVNGCIVEIDEASKKCVNIEKIKITWKL